MKKMAFMVALALCVVACSPKITPVQSCNFVSEQNGLITLRSVGYGKQKINALDASERNAIETVLFRGVAGSQYSSPMVGVNEVEAIQANPQYYRELLDNGRYKSFIISSIAVSDYSRTKYKEWNVASDITINVLSLRKDLEQHRIIRRFGL